MRDRLEANQDCATWICQQQTKGEVIPLRMEKRKAFVGMIVIDVSDVVGIISIVLVNS